jgi:hypothetical protein
MLKLQNKKLTGDITKPIESSLIIQYIPEDNDDNPDQDNQNLEFHIIANGQSYQLQQIDNTLIWNIPDQVSTCHLVIRIQAIDAESRKKIFFTNEVTIVVTVTTKLILEDDISKTAHTTTVQTLMLSSAFNSTNMIDQHCIIPVADDTRRVVMPRNYVIAIEDDNISQLLTFEIARYYDGIDKSEMTCLFKYVNANGDSGTALATNVIVDDDRIRVGWLLTNHVAYRAGNVSFQIEFSGNRADGIHRWSTVPAQFEITRGLRVHDGDIISVHPAIFNQLLERIMELEARVNELSQ